MPSVKGFVGGSYVAESSIVAGARCINLIPEPIPEGGKAAGALFPIPGVSVFATMPKGPGRGIYFENDRLFAVGGDTLYEVDAVANVTARGALLPDGNPVTMSTNGDGGAELFITSGARGDILDLQTNTFLPGEVSAVNFGDHLDGFFVGLDTATSTLKSSRLTDGQTWDGTDISQRSGAADRWLAMMVVNQEIYLFGGKTGEAYYNRGIGSGMTFARRNGAFWEVGIIAPYSLTRFGGSLAWLGRTLNGSGGVYWMNGYSPEEISTPAVRWAIQQYEDAGDISDAIGWSYERNGHEFYLLTFPDAKRTWVYDRLTNLWHERGLWDVQTADFIAYRPQFHAHAFGRNLVQDSSSGQIYELSNTVYTDVDGRGIRRVRRFPHLANENRMQYFSHAELECDRGRGIAGNGQGSNPLVHLRASNDGGQTWGADRARATGKQGKYRTRVRWTQCGRGRDRVWELWSSDPVPTRWFDFYYQVS